MKVFSLRTPFRKFENAKTCAEMLERMTGDRCTVETLDHTHHIILRDTGTKEVRG